MVSPLSNRWKEIQHGYMVLFSRETEEDGNSEQRIGTQTTSDHLYHRVRVRRSNVTDTQLGHAVDTSVGNVLTGWKSSNLRMFDRSSDQSLEKNTGRHGTPADGRVDGRRWSSLVVGLVVSDGI